MEYILHETNVVETSVAKEVLVIINEVFGESISYDYVEIVNDISVESVDSPVEDVYFSEGISYEDDDFIETVLAMKL